MLGAIISWCVFGLVVGLIARLLTPGPDPMGCFATIGLGVAGSFAGGFLFHLLFVRGDSDGFEPTGFIGAVIGGVLVLLLLRWFSRRPG